MSGRFALALAAGALLGGGLLAAVAFAIGSPPRTAPRRRLSVDLRAVGIRVGIGLAVAVVVLVVTRWLVLAVALGGLAASWQQIFGGAAEERAGIRRLDALASWTESLRDTIAGAVGLEQAIPATAATAAPAIRPSLNLKGGRRRTREAL
nr:hypothetical protein [Micromonospora sp. DSM 115978]